MKCREECPFPCLTCADEMGCSSCDRLVLRRVLKSGRCVCEDGYFEDEQ